MTGATHDRRAGGASDFIEAVRATFVHARHGTRTIHERNTTRWLALLELAEYLLREPTPDASVTLGASPTSGSNGAKPSEP